MKDHYEVTIGIPVYRSVKYIKETICSALSQTFLDIEFLIVDDCGDDGSMDVISLLQSNHSRGGDIRILRNDKNRGVSYCRNLIIDEAKGSYLYFMDSDDLIEPDTIRLLHDALIQSQVQIVYASYEIIDRVGKASTQVYKKASLVLEGEDKLAMYAFKHNQVFHVSVCNSLIDLKFLRQTGIRFVNISYWEDMVFTTELVTKVGRAVTLSDVTYHYILHKDSLSHYEQRELINKKEIQQSIAALDFIKEKCIALLGKPYLPFLIYNIEVNCFYVVCHIMENGQRIHPRYSISDMQKVLSHPMAFSTILEFGSKRIPNLFFWSLGQLPTPFFVVIMWLLGKCKRVICFF